MNLAHWLARSARVHAQRPAIAAGNAVWATYAEFAARAARTAAWLHTQGIVPGERVVLFMPNRPEYLPLLWGIWWAGAVAVPVNAKLHARETAWITGHCDARLVLTDAAHAPGLHAALLRISANVTGDFGNVTDLGLGAELRG